MKNSIVNLQNQPQEFCDALHTLHLQIQGKFPQFEKPIRLSYNAPEASLGLSDISNIIISDTSLLWKIPAFCLPVACVFDPGQMVHRLHALRAARIMRDPSKRNTLDFWLHTGLDDWIASQAQNLLMIQVGYNMTHQMEHFSLEMTEFLSARRPTVFLLNSFLNSEGRTAFGNIQPEQVLRQLSIQALEKIPAPQPLSFLAWIMERFQTANSCTDWAKIIGLITDYIDELYVILDLGVVNAQHIELLRITFRTLLCDTQSRARLKIMLMSSRKLEPAVDTTEIVISPTGNRRLPLKLSLSSVQKSLLSKLQKADTAAKKAANATATRAVSEALTTTTSESR